MFNRPNPLFTPPFPEQAAAACGQALAKVFAEMKLNAGEDLAVLPNYPVKKTNLEKLTFDTFGWKRHEERSIWYCEKRGFQLQVVTAEPNGNLDEENPFSEKELKTYRDFVRKWFTTAGGGIISCETLEYGGIHAFETIGKRPLPEAPKEVAGELFSYIYFLNIAHSRDNRLYQLKLDVMEPRMPGVRDRTVLDLLNKVTDLSERKIRKYYRLDPYKPGYQKGTVRTFAELPEFDEHFPWHPLNLIRNYFKNRILRSLVLGD